MLRIFSGLAIAALAAVQSAAAAPAEKPVSIVLVHGAFVDGSGWKDTYDLLSKAGYEVLVVQNSTETLDGDVATTKRAIALARHPVVLVGHSYGGMVITQAGGHPKVKSLVYVAAFAPAAGESVETLVSTPAPGGEASAPLLPPKDGYLIVDPAKFPEAFAAGVDPELTQFMAAAQVPWGLAAVHTKITDAAWNVKPTYFMLTTADHMIPPSSQRVMAKRANAKVVEIKSPHAVMLAHPEEVARFIEAAAQ